MSKFNIKATYQDGFTNAEMGLDLVSFTEDNAVIVYAPALDLSAAGRDFEDAKKSFGIALNEFLRYTIAKNTLIPELKKLGWKVKGGKKNRKLTAPGFSTLLKDNKEFEEIVENKNFQKFNERVRVPQFT